MLQKYLHLCTETCVQGRSALSLVNPGGCFNTTVEQTVSLMPIFSASSPVQVERSTGPSFLCISV